MLFKFRQDFLRFGKFSRPSCIFEKLFNVGGAGFWVEGGSFYSGFLSLY